MRIRRTKICPVPDTGICLVFSYFLRRDSVRRYITVYYYVNIQVKKMSNYNPNKDRENLSLDEIEALEEEEKRAARKAKFNIFNKAAEDGKGVDKDEVAIADNPTFLNFFKLLGRKLNQLLSVNIFMIFGNFPIFFFFLAMSGYFSVHTTSPYYTVYAPLRGAILFDNSAATSALWTLFSRQAEVTVHTTADIVLLLLTALLLFTFGPVRVGCTYILRNLFRGDPVFLFQDFFYAIKRNLKQALIYGFLDVLFMFLIFYDIVFFNLNYGANMMLNTMFFMSLCLAVLYFFMRHYIYLMLITFDLSIFKMLKNGLYFTVLGVKRNSALLFGTLFTALLEYMLLLVYFPLGVIVPFVILPALLMIMGVYAAYPKIKEIMIDPFYEEMKQKNQADTE